MKRLCAILLCGLFHICFQLGGHSLPFGKGDYTFHVLFQGQERFYKVHIPQNFRMDGTRAAVLVLHGERSNPDEIALASGWNSKADKENFLVVYPAGAGDPFRGRWWGSWNVSAECCPPGQGERPDDVAFIDSLIDKLIDEFQISPQKIYATGFSSGAAMVYRLGCELSHRLAAIGPVGGQLERSTCESKRAVPLLHVHGVRDSCSWLDPPGAICGGCQEALWNERFKLAGIPASLNYSRWGCSPVAEVVRDFNGCSTRYAIVYDQLGVKCFSYFHCMNEAESTFCLLENMGHHWPGHQASVEECSDQPWSHVCRSFQSFFGPPQSNWEATRRLWQFFDSHRLGVR